MIPNEECMIVFEGHVITSQGHMIDAQRDVIAPQEDAIDAYSHLYAYGHVSAWHAIAA